MIFVKVRNFVFLSLITFIPQVLYAQVELGLFGGLNGSRISSSDEAPAGIRPIIDYEFGISAGYQIEEKSKVLFDFAILRQGFESPSRIYGISMWDKVGYRNTYLESGQKYEYKFAKNLGLLLGGYTLLHLREEEKLGDNNWKKTKGSRFFRKLSVGLNISLRTYLNRIVVFASYDHGLSTVSNMYLSDISSDPSSDYWNLKFRTFKLGVGYLWNVELREGGKRGSL